MTCGMAIQESQGALAISGLVKKLSVSLKMRRLLALDGVLSPQGSRELPERPRQPNPVRPHRRSATKQRSELDAEAGRRVDRLRNLVAARQAAIHVRNHDAGVEVEPLDRPIVDQRGNEVGLAGAFAVTNGGKVELFPPAG